MKEFVLLFRMDITTKEAQPSEEQMTIYMQQWMKWINYISHKNQLADGGNHFLPTGRLLRPGNHLTAHPYTENKESLAGYIIILAKDIAGAVVIAKQCPILQGVGTSVEVRQTATPEGMKEVKRG